MNGKYEFEDAARLWVEERLKTSVMTVEDFRRYLTTLQGRSYSWEYCRLVLHKMGFRSVRRNLTGYFKGEHDRPDVVDIKNRVRRQYFCVS